MKVFKKSIKIRGRMMTIVILSLGVILVIIGLILGLKSFDPKYFNAIAGSIIAGITLFGLFGKLFQDIASSNIQQEIKKNTERNLQPFKITSLSVSLEYEFDNPIISNTLIKIDSIKKNIEELYSREPPAINGHRMLPSIPGIIAFEENNKINNFMIIEDLNFLSSCDFPFPKIKLQLSSKYPTENETSNMDGTNSVKIDFPISFELETIPTPEHCILNHILVDYRTNKINFNITPARLQFTRDNGEILSFTDLYGKFLKLSSYYMSWKDNEKKFNIVSLILFNEYKRLQFVFDADEKSNSCIDSNIAYLHQIKETDFYK